MPPPDTHPGPDSPDRVSETRPETPERTRHRNRLDTLSGESGLERVSGGGTVVQTHRKAAGSKGGPQARASGAPGAA